MPRRRFTVLRSTPDPRAGEPGNRRNRRQPTSTGCPGLAPCEHPAATLIPLRAVHLPLKLYSVPINHETMLNTRRDIWESNLPESCRRSFKTTKPIHQLLPMS